MRSGVQLIAFFVSISSRYLLIRKDLALANHRPEIEHIPLPPSIFQEYRVRCVASPYLKESIPTTLSSEFQMPVGKGRVNALFNLKQ
jgi:hypothetical protein